MSGYTPRYSGKDQEAAVEFRRLSEVLGDQIVIPLEYKPPLRPRIGRIVVADGLHWNPLSVGVPRVVWFNGTAWVALDA